MDHLPNLPNFHSVASTGVTPLQVYNNHRTWCNTKKPNGKGAVLPNLPFSMVCDFHGEAGEVIFPAWDEKLEKWVRSKYSTPSPAFSKFAPCGDYPTSAVLLDNSKSYVCLQCFQAMRQHLKDHPDVLLDAIRSVAPQWKGDLEALFETKMWWVGDQEDPTKWRDAEVRADVYDYWKRATTCKGCDNSLCECACGMPNIEEVCGNYLRAFLVERDMIVNGRTVERENNFKKNFYYPLLREQSLDDHRMAMQVYCSFFQDAKCRTITNTCSLSEACQPWHQALEMSFGEEYNALKCVLLSVQIMEKKFAKSNRELSPEDFYKGFHRWLKKENDDRGELDIEDQP